MSQILARPSSPAVRSDRPSSPNRTARTLSPSYRIVLTRRPSAVVQTQASGPSSLPAATCRPSREMASVVNAQVVSPWPSSAGGRPNRAAVRSSVAPSWMTTSPRSSSRTSRPSGRKPPPWRNEPGTGRVPRSSPNRQTLARPGEWRMPFHVTWSRLSPSGETATWPSRPVGCGDPRLGLSPRDPPRPELSAAVADRQHVAAGREGQREPVAGDFSTQVDRVRPAVGRDLPGAHTTLLAAGRHPTTIGRGDELLDRFAQRQLGARPFLAARGATPIGRSRPSPRAAGPRAAGPRRPAACDRAGSDSPGGRSRPPAPSRSPGRPDHRHRRGRWP